MNKYCAEFCFFFVGLLLVSVQHSFTYKNKVMVICLKKLHQVCASLDKPKPKEGAKKQTVVSFENIE
jgi:hypothetical protein